MVGEEFPFKVVRINGSDEVLARSVNLLIGRAAFETAKRLYPKDVLEYRRGAHIIGRSDPHAKALQGRSSVLVTIGASDRRQYQAA